MEELENDDDFVENIVFPPDTFFHEDRNTDHLPGGHFRTQVALHIPNEDESDSEDERPLSTVATC